MWEKCYISNIYEVIYKLNFRYNRIENCIDFINVIIIYSVIRKDNKVLFWCLL